MLTRRRLIETLALFVVAAPAIVRASSIMPVKPWIGPHNPPLNAHIPGHLWYCQTTDEVYVWTEQKTWAKLGNCYALV